MADAVILAGGFAKGAFGAGALSVLFDGAPLDVRRIVATSSGSLNGIYMAAAIRRGNEREAGHELAKLWIERATVKQAFAPSLRGILSREGLSSSRGVRSLIRESIVPTRGGREVELRIVVTTADGTVDPSLSPPSTTFESVLSFPGEAFDGGPQLDALIEAATASTAFPGIYLPVPLSIRGRETDCYDGGIVNNAPIKQALSDPDVTRVFVIAPYPSVFDARPADAEGVGLVEHVADILINERLHRDLREARWVNESLAKLAAGLPPEAHRTALHALGWGRRRHVAIVEIRPPGPLEGSVFNGLFSRTLREGYVRAGAQAARDALGSIESWRRRPDANDGGVGSRVDEAP